MSLGASAQEQIKIPIGCRYLIEGSEIDGESVFLCFIEEIALVEIACFLQLSAAGRQMPATEVRIFPANASIDQPRLTCKKEIGPNIFFFGKRFLQNRDDVVFRIIVIRICLDVGGIGAEAEAHVSALVVATVLRAGKVPVAGSEFDSGLQGRVVVFSGTSAIVMQPGQPGGAALIFAIFSHRYGKLCSQRNRDRNFPAGIDTQRIPIAPLPSDIAAFTQSADAPELERAIRESAADGGAEDIFVRNRESIFLGECFNLQAFFSGWPYRHTPPVPRFASGKQSRGLGCDFASFQIEVWIENAEMKKTAAGHVGQSAERARFNSISWRWMQERLSQLQAGVFCDQPLQRQLFMRQDVGAAPFMLIAVSAANSHRDTSF